MALQDTGRGRGLEVASVQSPEDPAQAAEGRTAAMGQYRAEE